MNFFHFRSASQYPLWDLDSWPAECVCVFTCVCMQQRMPYTYTNMNILYFYIHCVNTSIGPGGSVSLPVCPIFWVGFTQIEHLKALVGRFCLLFPVFLLAVLYANLALLAAFIFSRGLMWKFYHASHLMLHHKVNKTVSPNVKIVLFFLAYGHTSNAIFSLPMLWISVFEYVVLLHNKQEPNSPKALTWYILFSFFNCFSSSIFQLKQDILLWS